MPKKQLTVEERESLLKPISRVCPVCGGLITRRASEGRLTITKAHIEWRCHNSNCKESTHWNRAEEHWRR